VYYYIVIAVTKLSLNPSQIYTVTPTVKIAAQEPTEPTDQEFTTAVELAILYLIAIWIIIPVVGIVSGRRAGKQDLIDFTMDANVVKKFKGGTAMSFDSDVADLDAKIRRELGMGGTAPSDTDFLSQEVVKSVVPGVEAKETGMRNCPKCGWVLSATATKCIRCGYVLGEDDAPKEGGDLL
jgi:ribosomal protein L40E